MWTFQYEYTLHLYYISFQMFIKSILLALLVVSALTYEKEGNVLVLHDSDFPQVLEEHDYIMIEFYAPWCGHCKKLAPTYSQVADELEAQGSEVKLAKVDATVDTKAASQYKVQGYPTIFFFHKGEKIDYKGQRSKEYLLNWLLKKTRDPLVPIDQEGYEKLNSEDKVSIVFHGDANSEQGQQISKIAVADDYNTYYVAQVGQTQGSVEIFRPFGQTLTYENVDENLVDWIRRNERPPVVEFDDRTIGDMFSNSKPGVCLFNKDNSDDLLATFTESAKAYLDSGKQLIFTSIDGTGEHFGPFSEYIKIDPATMPVVLIEPKIKSKFVLVKSPADLSSDDITEFLENWNNGEAQKYGLTDEVQIMGEAEQL